MFTSQRSAKVLGLVLSLITVAIYIPDQSRAQKAKKPATRRGVNSRNRIPHLFTERKKSVRPLARRLSENLSDSRVIDSRPVEVNAALLTSLSPARRVQSSLPLREKQATTLEALQPKNSIYITLEGKDYEAVIDTIIQDKGANKTWDGYFKGGVGEFTLVQNSGRISGNFRVYGGGFFELHRSSTGYLVDQLNVDNSKVCALRTDAAATRRLRSRPAFPPADGPTHEFNLLVVYTPAARLRSNGGREQGSHEKIHDDIIMMRRETERALALSRTTARMGEMHIREIQYVEHGSLYVDRPRLEEKNDGHMDEVHAWRNEVRADIVVLISVAWQGGLANQMTEDDLKPEAQFAEKAFAAVDIDAGLTNRAFPHELGHVFGCGHDTENRIDRGPGMFGYSAGYHHLHNYPDGRVVSFRTTMSYRYRNDNVPEVLISYYSNPDVNHLSLGFPVGDSNHNNAATINISAPVVARFR